MNFIHVFLNINFILISLNLKINIENVTSFGSMNYIPDFDKIFPELKDLSREELYRRFSQSNIKFFMVHNKKVPSLLRLTMPLAIILILIMFIMMPINYFVTGSFRYDTDKYIKVWNWFEAIGFKV